MQTQGGSCDSGKRQTAAGGGLAEEEKEAFMEKKKFDYTNQNGMTGENDKTCGINDMNCVGEEDDKTCGLTNMNCEQNFAKENWYCFSQMTVWDQIRRGCGFGPALCADPQQDIDNMRAEEFASVMTVKKQYECLAAQPIPSATKQHIKDWLNQFKAQDNTESEKIRDTGCVKNRGENHREGQKK